MAIEVDSEKFWRDGFAMIRGVFSPEEIKDFRRAGLETRDHQGDLLSNPSLSRVVHDERLLGIVRQILGDELVYFGDSSCSINGKSRGYHKDNSDRLDPDAPDWDGRYPIVRCGIYMQDYTRHSGGLNFRRGSHAVCSDQIGETLYMTTQPGDLLVWNMRMTHSGNGRQLRFPRWLCLRPRIADRLPQFVFSPVAPGDRMAFFITYGVDGKHLTRSLAFLKTRKYMVESWKHSRYAPEVLDAARSKGLDVREVWKKISQDPDLGTDDVYRPLPY